MPAVLLAVRSWLAPTHTREPDTATLRPNHIVAVLPVSVTISVHVEQAEVLQLHEYT